MAHCPSPTVDFRDGGKVIPSSITRSAFMNSIIYIVGLVVVVVAVLSFFGLR